MRRIPVASAILLLNVAMMAVPAQAEKNNLSATYTNCMDNSGGVTFDMIECTPEEHEKQDKRLNSAYKQALKAVGDRANTLKEVQRAWLKYRDLTCGFAGGAEGSSARIIGSSCFLQMTAERADELQDIAKNQ
ncbi:lysozyme inhibitor LprI family protein [Azospirillum doebereinerae]|uniref:lysozyme inhibitor LprI family protein n=1 Tax=Azospirillum doebereinerae TaxID=92933 RepID=UPI001EE5370C|nr:lysozyme inhibitor LprI family protein [Azospirillum doebereinerae]MCG5243015.1 lysozyme inhibitor LprI family protein [Azospirillum doebereinerae]